jgi:ParB family chromosome partitioning protein
MAEVDELAEDARPRALGRGLSALIGDEAAPTRGEAQAKGVRTLPVAFLRPNPHQPRKRFGEEELRELAASLRERGVLQPILARPVHGEANAFEIVAGERRWRAAQLANLHDVPVLVRDISDSESLELALIENIQRADLNAIEEANAYQELMDRYGYTQETISQHIGKSRSHVANTLRLLKLPESVKAYVWQGKLSAGHARTLIGHPDPEILAKAMVDELITVRQAEAVKKSGKKPVHKLPVKDPNIAAYESSISNVLGLKVQIAHHGDKGGEVRISYKSLEQLEEIVHRLKSRG